MFWCIVLFMTTRPKHRAAVVPPEKRMHAARIRKGLSLRALADELAARGQNATNGQLSRIERWENAPRPALRTALADVLGIDHLTDLPPEKG